MTLDIDWALEVEVWVTLSTTPFLTLFLGTHWPVNEYRVCYMIQTPNTSGSWEVKAQTNAFTAPQWYVTQVPWGSPNHQLNTKKQIHTFFFIAVVMKGTNYRTLQHMYGVIVSIYLHLRHLIIAAPLYDRSTSEMQYHYIWPCLSSMWCNVSPFCQYRF